MYRVEVTTGKKSLLQKMELAEKAGSILQLRMLDMLAGRQQGIHAERNRRLETARKQRQIRRQKVA